MSVCSGCNHSYIEVRDALLCEQNHALQNIANALKSIAKSIDVH